MKNKRSIWIILLLTGLALTACQPQTPTPTPDLPPIDETPTEGAGEGEYTYGNDATVESLEVVIYETFPVTVEALLSGYLPDGCTELEEIKVEREGQTFSLEIVTRRPTGDIACTQALVPFEETVELNVLGLEAGTYTVGAQDQQTEFILQVDNSPADEPEDKYEYGSNVTVESVQVNILESFPVQVNVVLKGYLPDGCTKIQKIESTREDQTFILEIVTKRPGGDVACIQMIQPFEETVSLDVKGLPAGEYTVVCGDFEESFTLDVDNVPSDGDA